jgi:hypothetical protein
LSCEHTATWTVWRGSRHRHAFWHLSHWRRPSGDGSSLVDAPDGWRMMRSNDLDSLIAQETEGRDV